MSDDPPWTRGVRGTQILPLINHDAAAIRVEAGPGAGKTYGLRKRVHRLISPEGAGASPDEILVVAFNRIIARDLASTIADLLVEIETDRSPVVATVHALCRNHLADSDRRLLLDHEREMMIYDCATMDAEIAAAYPSYYERAQALRDHEAGHSEHPRLWRVSQRWLDRHTAHLVGDLPSKMLAGVENGDFDDLGYQHVIVDEFQDLSAVEQQLVVKLRRPEGSLVALGDPRQSIYAFRGNHRDGLRTLEALTRAPVNDITLTECQRCPAQIVAAANQLMSLDSAVPMVPTSTTTARIVQVHWKSPQAEAKGMAKVIAGAMDARPGDRHLVMVTRRRFGYNLRAALSTLDPDLSVHLDFSESVLEEWPAREAFLWFCLLSDPDPATWRSWLGHQSPTEAGGSFKPDKRNSLPYLDWLSRFDGPATAAQVLELADAGATSIRGRGRTLVWQRACRFRDLSTALDWNTMTAGELIDEAFSPVRWDVEEASPDSQDLGLLHQRAKEVLVGLTDYDDPERRGGVLKEVADDLRYAIATKEPLVSHEPDGLQITTLWGAKGLTADHVYVLGVCDQALPGTRPDDYPGDDEAYVDEQRRLLYVSITRSKETLVLSRANSVTTRENKRLNLNSTTRQYPFRWKLTSSRYVREIASHLPASIAGEEWNGDLIDLWT